MLYIHHFNVILCIHGAINVNLFRHIVIIITWTDKNSRKTCFFFSRGKRLTASIFVAFFFLESNNMYNIAYKSYEQRTGICDVNIRCYFCQMVVCKLYLIEVVIYVHGVHRIRTRRVYIPFVEIHISRENWQLFRILSNYVYLCSTNYFYSFLLSFWKLHKIFIKYFI